MFLFHLNDGADVEGFLMEVMKIEALMEEKPGYMSHELLRDSDGGWVDILRWKSIEDAMNASNEFTSGAAALGLASYVDLSSLRMFRMQQII